MAAPHTIAEAAPLLRQGVLTPVQLLESCLDRIDRFEPTVRAWAFLDRDRARAEAARLTTELKRGECRGPLHGIPVGIKDIIDVFDMPTACGSTRWANSYARRDATCVARLRQAGAVILGKTATTAYAFLDPSPTRNPWDHARTPGGSSSGSAAAVACGMAVAALGSQTGGSTTRPASFCGVASLKPTYGSVSVEGVLPLATSLDHIGVMAHGVRDLAIVSSVIAGPDGRRGFTFESHVPVVDSFKALEKFDREHVPELCVCGGLFDERLEEIARPLYRAALERLKNPLSGMLRVVPPPGFSQVLKWHQAAMATEAAAYHAERFRRHPDDYPVKIRTLVEDGLGVPAVDYATALAQKLELEDLVTRMLDGRRFLVTPAAPGVAPDAGTTGNAAFNAPWSFTGHPTVSLPYGWTADGLPLALQLVGSPGCEDDLFRAAAWCEEMLGFERREPLPA